MERGALEGFANAETLHLGLVGGNNLSQLALRIHRELPVLEFRKGRRAKMAVAELLIDNDAAEVPDVHRNSPRRALARARRFQEIRDTGAIQVIKRREPG